MNERGHVGFYDRDRGYGFVTREQGPDVFLHSSVVQKYGVNPRFLEPGAPVRFVVIDAERGPRVDAIAIG